MPLEILVDIVLQGRLKRSSASKIEMVYSPAEGERIVSWIRCTAKKIIVLSTIHTLLRYMISIDIDFM
jgi:hypothetical protein